MRSPAIEQLLSSQKRGFRHFVTRKQNVWLCMSTYLPLVLPFLKNRTLLKFKRVSCSKISRISTGNETGDRRGECASESGEAILNFLSTVLQYGNEQKCFVREMSRSLFLQTDFRRFRKIKLSCTSQEKEKKKDQGFVIISTFNTGKG